MKQSIDFLEKSKVFSDTLQTEVVPLSVAYKAVEMSIDSQLTHSIQAITAQFEAIYRQVEEQEDEGLEEDFK